MHTDQALAGVWVVDLTTDFGYASKLYADLGATVILVEPPGGSLARQRPPQAGGESLWFGYRNSGKRSIVLDPDAASDRQLLQRVIAGADIVFDDRPQAYWFERGLDWASVHAAAPDLVWCSITPFGQTGPATDAEGCDLIAMASGGMAWLTGYEDSGPLVGDCGLATTSAAQYAAVTALIAWIGRHNTGGGQWVDVSMQEVMALGTETAPQLLAMKGVTRRRRGEQVRQAGIGVYPCADGHVFLYAADSGVGRGWKLLAQWIIEAGVAGAEELLDPRWLDSRYNTQAEPCARFAALWAEFARERKKQALFEDGQARRIAISPLNSAADTVADPHLRARAFFDRRDWPGAPYRLSATPWQPPGAAPVLNADAPWVRREIERQRKAPVGLPRAHRGSVERQRGVGANAALPLAGLRVVDLTWVGAGPFTTKLLADFGAEVWKIESRERPDQLRRAEPVAAVGGLDASGYFANRNTNKKSVTLNLKQPQDLACVKAMLLSADLLANSFTPGAMDRLGLSWSEAAAINPRLLYLGMPFAGDDGPYRDYLGYGINIATTVGMFRRHGLPGRVPVGTGTNFPDHLPNPLHACFAVLAALVWRQRSGRGQRIAVAQIESTLAACPDAVLEVAATGRESPPSACAEPWRAPHGIVRCAGEDRWCALSVASDAVFVRLAALVGQPGLAPAARFARRTEVDALVARWAAGRSAEQAVDALRMIGVAAAVIATPDDLLQHDAQLAARGFWQTLDHPVIGRCVYHGVAAAFSQTPTRYRSGAPLLGQHNDELARWMQALPIKE